ncbi:MAG: hypothetical protein ABIO78_00520 [Thermoanaerobaculia bacterium]
MPESAKKPIIDALQSRFEFLMGKLGVPRTKDLIAKYVPVSTTDMPEYAAASAALTAAATVDPNEGE